MNLLEKQRSEFLHRHIGPNESEKNEMLQEIGMTSLDDLISKTVPESIRLQNELALPAPLNEFEYLREIKKISQKNKVYKSYIGQGYYGTITPSVILRNVFENPGWYTQYTPYQAEISQGRLESLLNFQTMVSDLTALPIANASLLDEATAAAEAMSMLFNQKNKNHDAVSAPKFFVDYKVFEQTKQVILTRATPLNIEVVTGNFKEHTLDESYFAALVQYPNSDGLIADYRTFIEEAHSKNVFVIMAADILSLAVLTPPGELSADVAIGSTQRFGVPMGFGGPHAAYFATKDEFKRNIPGRIIGVSIDAQGNRCLRMALQTREQHIRREKATSNICTAQALLSNMAAMYAVYHGEEGIKNIATRVHLFAKKLEKELAEIGVQQINEYYFDTLKFVFNDVESLRQTAIAGEVNFYYHQDGTVGITLDEATSLNDLHRIIAIFKSALGKNKIEKKDIEIKYEDFKVPSFAVRTSSYLLHPVFNSHRSESQLMRYIKKLENKDLSLNTSMISLGSCTMKLNAATELIPVSWQEFAFMHPFAPEDQTTGYQHIIKELEDFLSTITGFAGTSLQPNSGAQGEYAGLLTIRAYHAAQGQSHRNIVLIPISAHGTNPASAVMAGYTVVVTKCDENGNIDVTDLREKATQHKENLAALMVTYPSTHGVFEESIKDICAIIHENGGQVYMDGANMNAQVGITSPGNIGADVCHLNLHKTFAIPHGGGGPGVGPICVAKHLVPYLPGYHTDASSKTTAVSAAQYGSASILLISYAYIKMLGAKGLRLATTYAILNANYMKARLSKYYDILYTGKNDTVAHEFIIDLRPFKTSVGIEAEDVAKRLMDYGFHAPTLSFPVAGTLMVEPTESEDKAELDRFCDAMISIYHEIKEIENGIADKANNVLKNAPHTQHIICADEWMYPYSRNKAAFALPYVAENKFWPAVSRVNNTHGDRNLVCTCEPIESYINA